MFPLLLFVAILVRAFKFVVACSLTNFGIQRRRRRSPPPRDDDVTPYHVYFFIELLLSGSLINEVY